MSPAAAPRPSGNYLPAKVLGDVIRVSGQVARDGDDFVVGRLGADLTTAEGITLAARCADHALDVARETVGSLDGLGVQALRVYVACTEDFREQHLVANGASDRLVDALGESGRHPRSAIGVQALPFGAPVEIEAAFVRTGQER